MNRMVLCSVSQLSANPAKVRKGEREGGMR